MDLLDHWNDIYREPIPDGMQAFDFGKAGIQLICKCCADQAMLFGVKHLGVIMKDCRKRKTRQWKKDRRAAKKLNSK